MKKVFLINILVLLTIIFISELFIRLYTENGTKNFFGKRIYNYDTYKKYLPNYFETDQDQVFKLKKIKRKLLSFQDNSLYEVDIVNFKGVNVRKGGLNLTKSEKELKNILLIGDSYIFGVYLDEKFTISSNLQKLLKFDNKNYNVINAGYAAGFDPDQHYVFLTKNIKKFKPDIVIYGLYGGNDFKDYDENRWVLKDKYNLPIKIINDSLHVNDNGIIYNKDQDADNIVGTRWSSIPILKKSFFYVTLVRLLEKKILPLVYRDQPESKDSYGPFAIYLNKDYEFSNKLNNLENLINGMNRVSNQNKAKFIVLYHPSNFEVYDKFLPNNKKIIRDLPGILKNDIKENAIHFIDPINALNKSLTPTYPENGEVHYNKSGSKVVAKEIFDYLNKFNMLVK